MAGSHIQAHSRHAEREALGSANQRTLTQDFCGDPSPGYSALHGKTGER